MIAILVNEQHQGVYGAGQWKDVESLRSAMDALSLPTLWIVADETGLADRAAESGHEFSDIIIYYSFWPDLLARLRKRFPRARLHVRTVNAEALQHLHRVPVTVGGGISSLRSAYGAARLAWRDALNRRLADTLIGISEWDDRHYWERLPGSAAVVTIPYHSPWPLLRPHILPMIWEDRAPLVVCMAGGRDRIGRCMMSGFHRLSKRAQALGGSWRFAQTDGATHEGRGDRVPAPVEQLCDVKEPWDLLCSARVVAVLTPLGFGTKTTIIDGLAAGCHVVVHPALARRLPIAVAQHCEIHDPDHSQDLVELFARLSRPPRSSCLNEDLREQTREQLSRLFAPRRPSPSRRRRSI